MVEILGYTEFRRVGSGGNADVYQARPLGSHGVVAVKVIRSGGEPDVLRRFERERHLASALVDVANVVPVYQSGFTKSGDPYIVMPLFPGGSLDKRLQSEGPIHWIRAVEIVQMLTRAVALAHERRILHLDIKPANVLMDASGVPHLADFGIAELLGRTHSMSGALLTPAYTPPERLVDAKPSEMTDVYGLGATLFCMLTGEPPFGSTSGSPGAIVLSVLNDPAPVGLLPDSVPESLGVLLLECLAKPPEQRPMSARALQLRLADVRDRGGHDRDDDPTVPVVDWAQPTKARPTERERIPAKTPEPAASSQSRISSAAGQSRLRVLLKSWRLVLLSIATFVGSVAIGLMIALESGW